MRKILFISMCAIMGFLPNAHSQLIVCENGQTQMGNYPSGATSESKNTLNLWSLQNKGGGSISFGAGDNATISGDGSLNQLILKSRNLSYLVNDMAIGMSFNERDGAFNFTYNVKSPSFLTSSDARIKTNISSIEEMSSSLFELNPVSYNLLNDSDVNVAQIDNASSTTSSIEDDRVHFGFVAQEVQEIFPNLVVEDEEGLLSIDYTGFIPLLVDAYKKMLDKVNSQEELIAELINQSSPSFMPSSVNNLFDTYPILKQNRPNPFNSDTTIECFLPENAVSAYIYFYDLQGKQVHSVLITERGKVEISIEATSFSPGMYIYSLIVDGNEIDSKRMILTE